MSLLPRPLGRILMVGFLLFGAAARIGAQEDPVTGVLRGPVEGSYALGRQIKAHFPAICRSPIHWVVAVDQSGSMTGKDGVAKGILREWFMNVVTPGDRLTFFTFDARIHPPAGNLENRLIRSEERNALLTVLSGSIQIDREKGSQVNEARSRALEMAEAAAQSDASALPVTVVLTDRDDDDQVKIEEQMEVSRHLWERFRQTFTSREGNEQAGGSTATPSVEALMPLTVKWVSPQPIELLAFISRYRREPKGSSEGSPGERKVPLVDPVTHIPDPVTDTNQGIRTFLYLLPWLFALAAGGLLYALISHPFGRLINPRNRLRVLALHWNPFRPRLHEVRATPSASVYYLEPERPGVDTTVVRVSLVAPWPWKPWSVRMQALKGYQLHDPWGSKVEELILKPGEEAVMVVDDMAGIVAKGDVLPDLYKSSLRKYQWMSVCGLLFLLLLPLTYLMAGAFPPPQTPVSWTERFEPLCADTPSPPP